MQHGFVIKFQIEFQAIKKKKKGEEHLHAQGKQI